MTRGTISYHGALAPLGEACSLAKADILYVEDLMQVSAKRGLIRKAGIALRHLGFIATVFRNRKRKLMVVRDFSNVPLMLVFPLIRRMANRMLFVVNHNLQWTIGNRTERAAFTRLGRMGCRFAFFEHVPVDLLKTYGIDSGRCVALPHPVPRTAYKRDRTDGVKTISIIGQFRPEKGIDELLDQLAPLAGRYRIRLALPNLAVFQRFSVHANADWFEQVDTSTSDKYLQAIAACDAVVLSHPAAGYEHRASGLIADAAAAHVPVVVRNLPVLRGQVSEPAWVGECFDDLSKIADGLELVAGRMGTGAYDFETYNRGRTAQELARRLDEICLAI